MVCKISYIIYPNFSNMYFNSYNIINSSLSDSINISRKIKQNILFHDTVQKQKCASTPDAKDMRETTNNFINHFHPPSSFHWSPCSTGDCTGELSSWNLDTCTGCCKKDQHIFHAEEDSWKSSSNSPTVNTWTRHKFNRELQQPNWLTTK